MRAVGLPLHFAFSADAAPLFLLHHCRLRLRSHHRPTHVARILWSHITKLIRTVARVCGHGGNLNWRVSEAHTWPGAPLSWPQLLTTSSCPSCSTNQTSHRTAQTSPTPDRSCTHEGHFGMHGWNTQCKMVMRMFYLSSNSAMVSRAVDECSCSHCKSAICKVITFVFMAIHDFPVRIFSLNDDLSLMTYLLCL